MNLVARREVFDNVEIAERGTLIRRVGQLRGEEKEFQSVEVGRGEPLWSPSRVLVHRTGNLASNDDAQGSPLQVKHDTHLVATFLYTFSVSRAVRSHE